VREINPDEVAGFVRRAQELLTTGDLQAARLLLLRAAEAHDARAAFCWRRLSIRLRRSNSARPTRSLIWHKPGTGIRKPRNGERPRRDTNLMRLPAILADRERRPIDDCGAPHASAAVGLYRDLEWTSSQLSSISASVRTRQSRYIRSSDDSGSHGSRAANRAAKTHASRDRQRLAFKRFARHSRNSRYSGSSRSCLLPRGISTAADAAAVPAEGRLRSIHSCAA